MRIATIKNETSPWISGRPGDQRRIAPLADMANISLTENTLFPMLRGKKGRSYQLDIF